ncbi:hypothetical protein GT352_28065 [Streptomyces sp. SID1046]|uniref:hypothetical protein n=1 Tax=Streptomyces sp. SID1046 TaxID=2690249 RepID=UPI00136EFCFF|nr:hypothetical protein [Streptomyces sp. SID1046]MYV77757.1 hypothetical protein [Streptomyces sp. SID1046]
MTLDQRTRNHLKALIEELKPLAEDDAHPTVQAFMSGLFAGVGIVARIAQGATAEAALQDVGTAMDAAVGRAYLNGTLPTQPPTA